MSQICNCSRVRIRIVGPGAEIDQQGTEAPNLDFGTHRQESGTCHAEALGSQRKTRKRNRGGSILETLRPLRLCVTQTVFIP